MHTKPRPPAESGCLVWFRRDLRCDDQRALNSAIAHAQLHGGRVWCVFVFDRDILDALPARSDRRVDFIHRSVVELDTALRRRGGGLIVLHDRAHTAIPALAARLGVDAVFAGRDYEPRAVARDDAVAAALAAEGRALRTVKDQVIFERDEVLTGAGRPFTVYTPYRNAWMKRLQAQGITADAMPADTPLAPPPDEHPIPSLEDIGFAPTNLDTLGVRAGMSGAQALFDTFAERIGQYHASRDYPALKGPSYLSVHLRFGTVSLRRLVQHALQVMDADPAAAEGARVWLSELTWRDFYFQVLHHFPHAAERSFKPDYDRIVWQDGAQGDRLFDAWAQGRTGYPLVDAAMAQLEHSGYMHNRLRMVTASFLTKDLGIDWRRGERLFADKLIDFDLAANNGGWQWAASSGCDAQPYFRIFNPVTQSQKFDPQGRFIRRYLPQLASLPDRAIHAPWLAAPMELQAAGVRLGENYPRPVVDHDLARRRTLERYAVVKAG